MANRSDIFLGDDTVKLVGTGKSPVVDIEGGNNWNLSNTDGDFRIGDARNMLKMGVSLGGAGAGNARIWASSDLKLGSRGSSTVHVHGGGARVDGDIDADGELNVDDSITTDGNLFCLDSDSWAFIQNLVVGGVGFGLVPYTGGVENLGSSRKRWDKLYVKDVNKGSDRDLKTDVEDLEGGLDAVLDLRPVSYAWRDDGEETHLGLVGQEVAEVLPEVVNVPDDPDGHLGLDYTELVAVLVDAVQEQHAEKEALAERVEDQQERIEDLEERLAALEENTSGGAFGRPGSETG